MLDGLQQRAPPHRDRTGGAVAAWLWLPAALLVLNLALTFHNVWPTPWVTTGDEVSVEVAAIVLALCAWTETRGAPPDAVLAALALAMTALCLGRYAEVTAPALYGRPINLFWDAEHLPRVAAMLVEAVPAWVAIAAVTAAAALLGALYAILRLALARVGSALRHRGPRRAMAALSGVLVASWLAGHTVEGAGTLRWFSQPASSGFVDQLRLVREALAGTDARATIERAPLPRSDLRGVAGADVVLVFVESYGATTFDREEYAGALAAPRAALAAAIERGDRRAVSARVESPTFGGASWLAHSSLLSGVEIGSAASYRQLLASTRETLVGRFAHHGWRTVALMPGLKRSWPEGAFYGFDRVYDERAIGYAGPAFGWWRVPDQYSLEKLDALEGSGSGRSPRFLFFPTVNTHMPFRPTPPYQADWSRLLGPEPFDARDVDASLAASPEWTRLGASYVDSVRYALTVVAGWLERHDRRDLVLILVGDHQPAAMVSGQGATREVPVHVIARRTDVLRRLLDAGFEPGLEPRRPAFARMHELAPLLLAAFDACAAPCAAAR